MGVIGIKEARILIVDNSDAQNILCIHANVKKNKVRKSPLGNTVKVTIKKRIFARDIIKKKVAWVYVCSTGKELQRKSGIVVKFKGMSGFILNASGKEMLGTTHKATVPKELKIRVLELAPYSKYFI